MSRTGKKFLSFLNLTRNLNKMKLQRLFKKWKMKKNRNCKLMKNQKIIKIQKKNKKWNKKFSLKKNNQLKFKSKQKN